MREKFTSATIARWSAFAMAGFVLAATIDVASASTSTGSAGATARLGVQQSVRVTEVVAVTKPKYVKKTSLSKKPRRSQKTWLNPQPEPPMGAAKINQGNNWLNPQPEPPRPVTGSKKLQ
jgi:hypothetical protein